MPIENAKPLPRLIREPLEWRQYCRGLKKKGSLGFVPTMGALHAGHLSLCSRAKAENDAVVASVFVNPTQFDDPRDLIAYPARLAADLEKLGQVGVAAVFSPEYEDLYPDAYSYKVAEIGLSQLYCGAHRPGHFDGVLTVVLRLLILTGADAAYFGEKDFQQYLLIRGLAEAFFLETRIVPCPILREPSGLAMSSRNERLTGEERERAGALYRIISTETDTKAARRHLKEAGFSVEYLEDLHDETGGSVRRLAAVRFGGVRLIDNVPLPGGKEPSDD